MKGWSLNSSGFSDCLQVCERTTDEVQCISKSVGADILAEAILPQEATEHQCFQFEVSKEDQIG